MCPSTSYPSPYLRHGGSGDSGESSDDEANGERAFLAQARERTAKVLQRRKQMKRRLMQVAAKFNKAEDGAAKKWIPYAMELELLTPAQPASPPADANAVALANANGSASTSTSASASVSSSASAGGANNASGSEDGHRLVAMRRYISTTFATLYDYHHPGDSSLHSLHSNHDLRHSHNSTSNLPATVQSLPHFVPLLQAFSQAFLQAYS